MNHHHSTPRCTLKKPTSNSVALKNESRNGYKWNESAATRSRQNLQSWTKVQNLGHPQDAPIHHDDTSWRMRDMRRICITHSKSLRGIDSRNTIQGGWKGLLNSVAEHSSPQRMKHPLSWTRKSSGTATAMTIWPTTSEWQRTKPPQNKIIAGRQTKS